MSDTNKKTVTAVVMGAGSRGREAYGAYGEKYPERINFIAVAEPDEKKRKRFQEAHDIPDDMAYDDWKVLLGQGKIGDVAFVTMPDHMHYEPAMRALELGYDLLLEKPIAPKLYECQALQQKAEEKGALVQVGHVLRFSHFWKKVKEIIDSGRIGDIVHYEHSENVSYWHFGHSFVRGAYNRRDESNPLILAKSCHDLDLMTWMLGKPLDVKSTGDLSFYRPENAPEGSPKRCTDGCPYSKECPWYAPRLYMDAEPLLRIGTETDSFWARIGAKIAMKYKGIFKFLGHFIPRANTIWNWDQFPVTAITSDLTPEGKMKALREGPFGLCIYKCGNDVVDHQISTFEFPKGVTGTLIVHGLSEHEGRELRVFGTKGTIRGYFRTYGEKLEVTDFRYRNTEVVYKSGISLESAHGGSDFLLMDAFTSVLLDEKSAEDAGLTTISSAMESHYMGFAADKARIDHSTVEMGDFRPKK